MRLGRLVALCRVDCSRQSAASMLISAQLQANQLIVLVMKGWPGCAWADCWHSVRLIALEQSVIRLPSSAQLQLNGAILVLKCCFRLGEPTRVPIPRQGGSSTWRAKASLG